MLFFVIVLTVHVRLFTVRYLFIDYSLTCLRYFGYGYLLDDKIHSSTLTVYEAFNMLIMHQFIRLSSPYFHASEASGK